MNCMHFSNLGVNELSKKSLMVSEVTTVLKFWGQVVVASTFGTCLAGYGRDFHVSITYQPLLFGLVCCSLFLLLHVSSLNPSLSIPHTMCYEVWVPAVSYVILHPPDLRYRYDVQKCNVLYIIVHVPPFGMEPLIHTTWLQLTWSSLTLVQLVSWS